MTNFELRNPRYKANPGSAAFLAGIPQSNNPYNAPSAKQKHELWEKGYRAAKKAYETGKPLQERDDKKRFSRDKREGAGRPVLSDRRIEKFNSKYRTTA